MYQIDYDSLGRINETESSELSKFKLYIETELSDLLKSHDLEKNISYDDGIFDAKSSLVQLNHTMTFFEFVSCNLMKLYRSESFLRGIITDSKPLQSHALKDRNFTRSIDILASNIESAVESFKVFDASFAKFNFYIYEEYVSNRDRWLQSDVYLNKVYMRDSTIDSTRIDAAVTLCDAFLAMHRNYSLDYSTLEMLDEFDNIMLQVFKSHLEIDLNKLAEKCGLKKSKTYADDTFSLESLDLSPADLSSFMDLISHAGLLHSSLDDVVTRQEILNEMLKLDTLVKPARVVIDRFKMFETEFSALNEDLAERYKSFYNQNSRYIDRLADINKHYMGHVEDVYSEFDRLFRILYWHTDCIYDIDYRDIRQIENLDKQEFENFYCDTEASIASLLKKHHLKKKIVYQTRSFTLEPENSLVYKGMSLDEFVDSHLVSICNSETLIDLMKSEAAYDILDTFTLRLADERMSDLEIEHELHVLRDFIDKMRAAIESFVSVRRQITKIKKTDLFTYSLNLDIIKSYFDQN